MIVLIYDFHLKNIKIKIQSMLWTRFEKHYVFIHHHQNDTIRRRKCWTHLTIFPFNCNFFNTLCSWCRLINVVLHQFKTSNINAVFFIYNCQDSHNIINYNYIFKTKNQKQMEWNWGEWSPSKLFNWFFIFNWKFDSTFQK